MTREQDLLEAIAAKVVAKRQTLGANMQDAMQNQRNENPKENWTFEEKDLTDEEGWTMQMNCAVKKKVLYSRRYTLSLHPSQVAR